MAMQTRSHRSRPVLFAVIIASPLAAAALSLFFGAMSMSPAAVFGALADAFAGRATTAASIVMDIRLPRILVAGLTGAALAGGGAALQAVFRNPLVDPYILGISSGASFGCALGVAFLPQAPLPLLAFAFGVLAVTMAFGIARIADFGDRQLTLVLAGIIVSALFTALLSMIKFLVDPQRLQAIVFWLLGSFNFADWRAVAIASVGVLAGVLPLLLMRWRFDALSMGEDEARALGVDVTRERTLLIVGATLAAATAVSVSGTIGWIGLIAPHLVRFLVGPSHGRLIPAALAGGAAFTILADTAARSLGPVEIPVGVVTALAGAPFFVFVLRQAGRARA
jgi:iron complex transport system permease protein